MGRMTRTFRNRTYPVLGYVFGLPLALTAIGCVIGAAVAEVPLAGSLALLLGAAAAAGLALLLWRTYVATRVEALDDAVVVVNPWRTTVIPWAQLEGFSADRQLVVHRRGESDVRVFAVQAANAARMLGRDSHADHVARDLNELLAEHRGLDPHVVEPQYTLTPEKRIALRRRALGCAAAMIIALVIRLLGNR